MAVAQARSKVGVVGAGMVGASFAYALMQRGLVDELVLIDSNHARAEGEAMDLSHGLPYVRPMRIWAGDYADLAGAAVTVITAGSAQAGEGETRLQLLGRNAQVFREVVPQVVQHNPDGIIVVATNPVDILTYLTTQISGLPPQKVIGSGTTLDTARLRTLLAEHYQVDPRSLHAYIVGEHGDSSVPLWSMANIGGAPLADFRRKGVPAYDQSKMQAIFEGARGAAYAIVARKKATYYAIGLSLLAIVETIVRDQRSVLTVSSLMQGQYGVRDICVSLPTIIGANGVEEVLQLPLSADEQAAFGRSAATLREHYASLSQQ